MNKIRREIDKLKRENSRLRKLIRRFEAHLDPEVELILEQEAQEKRKKDERKSKSSCTTCGGENEELDLGIRKYLVCKDCKNRLKVK